MAVRRESVELSLNDVDFTTGMAKAAASAALLNRELGNLDGSSVKANRSTSSLGDQGIKKTGDSARRSSADIDKYSGRLGLLAKTALAIGPALVPISAAAIPAIAGLTMGFGAAAGAAGVALLAFNGVGDAVKAMDAYSLQPTAANLAKMQQAMQNLGPAGANFARFIDGLEPQLRALQGSARAGLFPGVQEGITELLPLLPKVQDFVGRIGTEMGDLAAKAGKGLTSDAGFQKFAHYIDTEGVPIMDAFAKTTGKVASGLVALAADMAPLTGDFLGGMEHAADSFQKWAEGLDKTDGFREFVAYVEKEGPQVVDLLKTVASTGLSIAEAFAPIGAATLPALTAVAKVIGLIASSPLGPVIATVVSLNAAIGLGTLAVDKLAFAWKGVAASAATAAEAEALAAGAGAKGGASKLSLVAGRLIPAALIGAAASGPLNSLTDFGDTSLSDKNLTKVGSNLHFANPGIGGRGQGTVNTIFGGVESVGSLVGIKGQVHGEQSSVSSIDQQLAALVSSGQAEEAAKRFDVLSAAARKSGASIQEIAETFPHYTSAAKDADAATKADSDSTLKLSTSAKGLSAQFREGTISLSQFRAGLASVHQEALNDFDAVTQFGSAVQAAAKQAKDGAKAGLNPFTAAGNANRQAISQMVATWNQQPAAIQNNVKQYQAMKAKLGEFMGQMGASKAQIADFTAMINKPKRLVVQAQTSAAMAQIAQVKSYLDSLHDRSIHVSVATSHTNATIGELAANQKHAAGGYISGPGGPRDDLIPARLSNGEFVVNAATTARLRPWLEHENAKGFASGGLVGSDFGYSINSTTVASSSSSSSSSAASKSKEKATKAEEKAAVERAKTAKAAAALSASLIHLHKTVDPHEAKAAKGMLSSLNHASKIVDNTFGELDRVGQRWDGWTASEMKTIAAAEKATIALNKMKVSTFAQIKAYDKAADKAAEREKDALKVATDHRQAVLDDMASIKDSIAQRYRSDVFGNVDASSIAYKIDPKTGKYVDSKQSSALQLQGITAGLQKDIADAQAAKAAEASVAAALKKQGFGKDKIDAYTLYMEQNASVGQMQALAANPAIAAQQAQLYAQRQIVSAATGQALADQIDKQALAAATKTANAAQAAYDHAVERAKKADARYAKLEKENSKLRNYIQSQHAKDIGNAVGSKINTAAKGK